MQTQIRNVRTMPLFNAYGFRIGDVAIEKAIALHGTDLELRAKGSGRRRRFTSARLYARNMTKWVVRPSAGFSVLQLVIE
jgi:hypothetical protein